MIVLVQANEIFAAVRKLMRSVEKNVQYVHHYISQQKCVLDATVQKHDRSSLGLDHYSRVESFPQDHSG